MSKVPLVQVIYYSTYGHVEKLARHMIKGLEKSGVHHQIYQVPETLSKETLMAMKAPTEKPMDIPVLSVEEMEKAHGYLFGVPTRFGTLPAQLKEIFDSCGPQWIKGTFHGKYAGTFFSTSTQGAGQETTALSCVPFFVHHGINYVPIGYKFNKLNLMEELHGGSPWGAGTFSGFDNKRPCSKFEIELAEFQGEEFGNLMKRVYCAH